MFDRVMDVDVRVGAQLRPETVRLVQELDGREALNPEVIGYCMVNLVIAFLAQNDDLNRVRVLVSHSPNPQTSVVGWSSTANVYPCMCLYVTMCGCIVIVCC